jgi:hypothetical protein
MTDSAVLPEARRRRIGRALALTRLQFGGENQCTRAILAPSPDGAELWRSLGFVESRQPRNRWFYLPFAPTGLPSPKICTTPCPDLSRPLVRCMVAIRDQHSRAR